MGKRSNFERLARDHYLTPRAALKPLLPYLHDAEIIYDPCCGCNGESGIAAGLRAAGYHVQTDACDARFEVFDTTYGPIYFVTNPPWRKDLLLPIIDNLARQAPTWMLLSADFAHNRYLIPYLDRLHRIVSVGRIKWIEGSAHSSLDNCAWYLFGKRLGATQETIFVGRRP